MKAQIKNWHYTSPGIRLTAGIEHFNLCGENLNPETEQLVRKALKSLNFPKR